MKKFLSIFIVLLFLLTASTAFATWTVTASRVKGVVWGQSTAFWQYAYLIKVTGTSDGTDLAAFKLSTYLASGDMSKITGGMLYQVETDPGVAPDVNWTVAIHTDLQGTIGAAVLSLSGLSTTATEIIKGSEDLGIFPMFFDLWIDIGDIGSAADVVNIYLYIVK